MTIQEQMERLRSNQVFLFPWRYEAADTMEKLANALASVGLATELPQSTIDLIYECRITVQTIPDQKAQK